MNTEQLQDEVNRLEARRAELVSEVAASQNVLDEARLALTDGRAGAVKQVTASQATHSALVEATASLDRQIEQRQAELAAARAADRREEELARFLDVARRGESALKQYLGEREQANAEIKVIAGRLQASFDVLLAVRNEWIGLARSEKDDVLVEPRERIEAAGVDATGVRVQWSGSDPLPKSDDAYRLPPVLPYGNALLQIFRLQAEARKREALEAGQAA